MSLFSHTKVVTKDKISVESIQRSPIHLRKINGEVGLKNVITDKNLHRPQLALAGFVDLFTYHRVQVFGNTEMYYLKSLEPEQRINAFAKIAFWSSSNIEENVRTYQKIDQVFANITGIANFLMLICFFLVKSRQNLHLKQYLMVGLYEYVKEKEQKSNFSSHK